MKYFLHSTDSFDDEKITELFLAYGYEGLGLFYTLLEKIGKQEKPIKTSVLKAQLKVGKKLEKCWQFMEEIGIISSNNGDTFNERILSYSETYQIKKEKTREKVSQWREKQSLEKLVTSYVPVSNPPKVKESKVKESNIDIEADKPPATSNNSIEFKVMECDKRELIFYDTLKPYVTQYGAAMIRKFYDHFRERNKSKTKMKFEMQDTWDVNLRLIRWESNNNKFDKDLKPATQINDSNYKQDRAKAEANTLRLANL